VVVEPEPATGGGTVVGDPGSTGGGTTQTATGGTATDTGDQLLDPDGLVDNTLTIVVAVLGGVVIGLIATFTLAFLAGSAAFLGIFAWLGATAYLARQRTVQGAVSKAAFGVAAVLLLVPLIPLSPFVEMDPSGRAVGAVVLLITFGFFAAVAALVGYIASRFVPDPEADAAEG
jgi:hypothetical protein